MMLERDRDQQDFGGEILENAVTKMLGLGALSVRNGSCPESLGPQRMLEWMYVTRYTTTFNPKAGLGLQR